MFGMILSFFKRGKINFIFFLVERLEWYLGLLGWVIRMRESLFSNSISLDDNFWGKV